MFLVRSAFWLTVAFVALHPQDMDLGASAHELSNKAMAAGQRIVVSELLKTDCPLVCAAASSPLAAPAAGQPVTPVGQPMQDSPTAVVAPIPRPRPHWLS